MTGSPLIIDDGNIDNDLLYPSDFSRGYEERDYALYPVEMFASPSDMPEMSLTEIADRIKDHEANQSSLRHIRRRALNGQPIPSLDQNGQGYCWAYSNTIGVMLTRARDNQPPVRLSAHGVACKVKNFVDQGGWCGLSAKFIRENGIPSVEAWPEKSMSRSNDNATTWANAALHKITEDYVDLSAGHIADQNLTKKQVLTQLVLNNPCATDFNWWGHSVCAMWATLLGNASQNLTLDMFGIGIINSWTDKWGDLGESVLQGSKSVPNGAVCTRVSTPSNK